jgi:alkylated DNA repair dioxygenase AlkB
MQFFNAESSTIQVIAPGLVIMKGALNKEKQIWLAEYALKAREDPQHGFWTTLANGEKVLNSNEGRGRIYDTIKAFPNANLVQDLCEEMVSIARGKDNQMPPMFPTHLLLLHYASPDGMCWHRDDDPNDGDNDHPIVSVSVGNSCEFGYKLTGKPESTVLLESGDVLIWGGPCRMLLHCVRKVSSNTCPDYLPIKDVRLNFTFRDAPNVIGKENKYKIVGDD